MISEVSKVPEVCCYRFSCYYLPIRFLFVIYASRPFSLGCFISSIYSVRLKVSYTFLIFALLFRLPTFISAAFCAYTFYSMAFSLFFVSQWSCVRLRECRRSIYTLSYTYIYIYIYIYSYCVFFRGIPTCRYGP